MVNSETKTKVSIIGGSGFIGSRLCKRLDKDAQFDFSVIDKRISKLFPDKTFSADVRDFKKVMSYVPKEAIIVNLAAEHRDDVRPKSLYDEVNVEGAENVCATAKKNNVKTIIFTSSAAVYGFAPVETDENGEIAPFNDYGRTKYEAEQVYRAWQKEDPAVRALVIVRPAVVFGEGNRGNVYNLLKQIEAGFFVMVGNGKNKKSMAYVENVAAFLEYMLFPSPGIHVYNYVDGPDFTMNDLVKNIRRSLSRSEKIPLRMPYFLGRIIGGFFDAFASITQKSYAVSMIRIKKFCSNSVFSSSVGETGFVAPVTLTEGLERTIKNEVSNSSDERD